MPSPGSATANCAGTAIAPTRPSGKPRLPKINPPLTKRVSPTNRSRKPRTASTSSDSRSDPALNEPNRNQPKPTEPKHFMRDDRKYFLPYQHKWILDRSPLKIIEK